MPKKSPSQWSEAYRRRIANAEAKGLTRQQARGHKAKEHITRKQSVSYRLLNPSALTPSQKGQVTRFMGKLPARYDTEANKQRLIQQIEARGWNWFESVKQTRKELIQGAKDRPRGSGVLELGLNAINVNERDDLDWLLFYGAV